MIKLLAVVGVCVTGFAVYKLVKELHYLHRCSLYTADLNARVEILYSRLMEALTLGNMNDRQRLISIWDCLSNYRA